jgi:hypothetical protein
MLATVAALDGMPYPDIVRRILSQVYKNAAPLTPPPVYRLFYKMTYACGLQELLYSSA